ncbi:MAG: MGMT family protein [Brumimicrobium sp.]
MMKRVSSINDDKKDFYQRVFEITRLIPKGRVTSYGAIAKALGATGSSRMIGWALNGCSKEHGVPIPAHRVVNRNGVLTGKHHFNPPSSMQKQLEAEGIEIKDDKVVDFEKLFWDPIKELSEDW